MEHLSIAKSVLIKEIIRFEEEMYLLHAEVTLPKGWEVSTNDLYLRTDLQTLSEILRLENPGQTNKIEEIVLSMLAHGEPPSVDIKKISGRYLRVSNCELIIREYTQTSTSEGIHKLPQIVDVFPTQKTQSLSTYLNLEKEFSKDILEKTFEAFQKTFYLMSRGYELDVASALMQTNNPISAFIYEKIKNQLDPSETTEEIISEAKEEILEENYSFVTVETNYKESIPF